MLQFALLVLTIVLGYYFTVKYKRRKWPPGPFPYPIIGNNIEICRQDPEMSVAFAKMAKKYGNIFSIQMGMVPVVIVNGWHAVKHMNTLESFMGKFNDDWCLDRCYGSQTYGLFFSTKNAWRNNRRFTETTLKSVGFGKAKTMDALMTEEFKILCERIKRESEAQNGIFHLELAFNAAFVNIIYCLVTGIRFEQNDAKLHELVQLFNDWFKTSGLAGGILASYPFLKDYIPEYSGFGPNHRSNVKLQAYFQELINNFRQKGDYRINPTNFIDFFLQRLDSSDNNNEVVDPTMFSDKNLICLLMDIFSAGSDSSAYGLAFTIRHFVQNPKIQTKVQEEIDQIVGRDRNVTLDDKPKLKYTEATILEVLRFNTLSPFVPRLTNAVAQIGGFEIPKETHVMPNLHSANHDPTIWDQPNNFRPERFLDENGNLINAEKILTFSSGKRNCIGESVAKSSIFMGVCMLAQHFTFEVNPQCGTPEYGHTDGLTIAPLPFSVRVRNRYT